MTELTPARSSILSFSGLSTGPRPSPTASTASTVPRMPTRPRWTVSKVVQEIDLESGAPAADAPAGGSDPVIDPTALSNLLLAGSSRADMEAILTDTMSGGTATKFHRALEAILETGEGPDLEKLKEAVDVVCTTLKLHIANMI